MKRSIILLFTSFCLTACAPALFPVEGPVTASLKDSGTKTSLISNQALVVRLPDNPSTGYVWSYTAAGDDVLRVERVDSEFTRPKGKVGVPGEQVWSFRAQGSGQAVLTYEYARPWEKNTPPAKVFTLSVEVVPVH